MQRGAIIEHLEIVRQQPDRIEFDRMQVILLSHWIFLFCKCQPSALSTLLIWYLGAKHRQVKGVKCTPS